jgi:hypothetical protein
MGGEAEKKAKQELRELTIALNEAETENAMTGIKLNKQRKMLNRQEVADQKEKIATKAENYKAAYEADKLALEEKLKQEGLSFQQRRDLIKADLILNAKDRKKLNDDINKEEKKSIDDHNKSIADLNKKYDDEKLNRLADTSVKKEELDYQRKVSEIEKLAETELEKQTLIEKLDAEHKARMGIAAKTDDEKKIADAKIKAEAIVKINLQAADALAGIGNLAKVLAGENKELMAAGIIAESAAGIAKIIINTNAGAAVEVGTKGIFGLSTSAVLYTNMAISIASVIASTTQALNALGKGGSPSGGGNTSAPPPMTRPQSSRVSFDSGGKPISVSDKSRQRVYVVERDITNAQNRVALIQARAKID